MPYTNDIRTVIDRRGNYEEFAPDKIFKALISMNKHYKEEHPFSRCMTLDEISGMSSKIVAGLNKKYVNDGLQVHISDIRDTVELELMKVSGREHMAKFYILGRAIKDKLRNPDIFRGRVALKPYDYPELVDYVDAIQKSYWVHTQYNFDDDVQTYLTCTSHPEKEAIVRTMLAISQIEVNVKQFWGKIYDKLPIPEIANVGATFSESEVRHQLAYSHALDLFGLNDRFSKILEVPCIKRRIEYLDKSIDKSKSESNEKFTESVLLFSLFIEHVSLFSQFLIIMSYYKHGRGYKGMSNVVEATSKEEQLHGDFGIELINIIKKENPSWFGPELIARVRELAVESFEAESDIIDWIFEDGELEFLSKATIKEYVKDRLNSSMVSIGFDELFIVDKKLLESVEWMDIELNTGSRVDRFNKHSVAYSKGGRVFKPNELFFTLDEEL